MKKMKYLFICYCLFITTVSAENIVIDERVNVGLSLLKTKQYALAEKHFEQLLSETPNESSYLNNLAVAQMAQGKSELALENLKRVVYADTAIAVSQNNINKIYAYMASQAYVKALEESIETVALPELESLKAPKLSGALVAKAAELPEQVSIERPTVELIVDLQTKLAAWSNAWMRSEVETYLSFYSNNFIPAQKLSLQTWQDQRRYRLQSSQHVKVRVEKLRTFFNPDLTTAITEFVQHYSAGNYSDVVTKQLRWVLEGERWLIILEQVVEE